jgi:para-nitrobenzyl esterase
MLIASRKTVLALLMAILLSAILAVVPGCGGGSASPVVNTNYGKVEGQANSRGILSYKGIPYAAPPVKELRFKPPLPPKPWSDTLHAILFGPIAPQTEDLIETGTPQRQSEDCLYLNVWTPGTDGRRRPVMVWIHGGGFTNGSGSDTWYDGATFAERGGVVVVTLNYRLGALGFLYLGVVGGPQYAQSGNLGLLDQIAALKWVRDNIAAFGGDPGNVTIFGESAGSMSVCTLMGTPAAKGLFRRAIAESGGLNLVSNTDVASGITRRFMAGAGVTDMAGLLSLTADQIIKAQGDVTAGESSGTTTFGPVVDGSVLPEPPLHAIEKGSAAGVDFMIGTNLDEVRFWLIQNPALAIAPLQITLNYIPILREVVGANSASISASYKSRRPAATDGDITMAVTTDVMFRVPSIRVAEAQSAQGPNTRMYLFTWPSPVHDGILRSCHALELPFVWNVLHAPRTFEFLGANPPQKLADTMQNAWIAFAKTGDPNNGSMPNWPTYDQRTRATMILDVNASVQDDPYSADRVLWDGIPFDSVDPAP